MPKNESAHRNVKPGRSHDNLDFADEELVRSVGICHFFMLASRWLPTPAAAFLTMVLGLRQDKA
jgi:hypothetical protein